MLGIRYMKANPTVYVMQYQNGTIRREGAGLSFLYYAPMSTLVLVPLNTMDLPFAFTEATADFQTITLQGQLSYRVIDPKRLAGLLNYALRPQGEGYGSDDPETLGDRLINHLHAVTRAVVQGMLLDAALKSTVTLASAVHEGLEKSEFLKLHGIEVLALSFLSIRPTPETAKALEAEAREALLRRSDEAIYARRNAAIEQERTIKESELNTQLAVDEKDRQIREAKLRAEVALQAAKMKADIALEHERAQLVDQRMENDRKEIETRGFAIETNLKPLRDLDWKALMALGKGGIDSKTLIAFAFKEMAENAGKIGELNMTPDLLKSLIGER